jgi:protein CMS1
MPYRDVSGSKRGLANAIQDTASWDKPRTLDSLPGFLEKYSGNSTKLWSASKKNGAPHTIIVTAAGLRAADIARYLNNGLVIHACQ